MEDLPKSIKPLVDATMNRTVEIALPIIQAPLKNEISRLEAENARLSARVEAVERALVFLRDTFGDSIPAIQVVVDDVLTPSPATGDENG